MFHSVKTVPATVSFVDIAGIVKGASEGAGLGNKFLANIREADAICQVVRVFADDDVVHVDGRVDPLADVETVNTELILADLQTLEKAIPRLEKEARNAKDRKPVLEAAQAANALLDQGRTLFSARATLDLGAAEGTLAADREAVPVRLQRRRGRAHRRRAAGRAGRRRRAGRLRSSSTPRSNPNCWNWTTSRRAELLESVGQSEPGLHALARAGFHTLGLQTYLTAGPKESRAWTIKKGATAPQAAGVIHTDFERGFIKAEVVSYADLMAAKSMAAAKAAGRVRIEGKDYVMADGDVVEFRFNV